MNRQKHHPRRASALLLILFLMALTTPLLCLLFDTHTTHVRCVHNDIELRTALYVAEAGVEDAMSELLLDPAWRKGFTDKEFPVGLGHTYTVTLADAEENQILVTSTAQTASGHTKTITALLWGF